MNRLLSVFVSLVDFYWIITLKNTLLRVVIEKNNSLYMILIRMRETCNYNIYSGRFMLILEVISFNVSDPKFS